MRRARVPLAVGLALSGLLVGCAAPPTPPSAVCPPQSPVRPTLSGSAEAGVVNGRFATGSDLNLGLAVTLGGSRCR